MQRKLIFSVITSLTIMALPVVPSVSTAGHDIHSHSHGETLSGENPLIEEMMILDDVFRKVVSAVALGEGEKVHEALESMHGTMEKTHKGVHEGIVKLPKNAHREKEFIKRDKAFHAQLERLAEAGQKNDQAKMLSLTKILLDGCVNCHRDFRQ
jgi:hypothetical protein